MPPSARISQHNQDNAKQCSEHRDVFLLPCIRFVDDCALTTSHPALVGATLIVQDECSVESQVHLSTYVDRKALEDCSDCGMTVSQYQAIDEANTPLRYTHFSQHIQCLPLNEL
eukprot:scaffold12943_cov393-Alexandrium_tamarense.AAC.3